MTDKKTDNTDETFNLNHFDQADKTEPFYADEMFAETEQQATVEKNTPLDATWDSDEFTETGYEKKEPSIPQQPTGPITNEDSSSLDKQREATDIKAEPPGIAPPKNDPSVSEPPAEQRSGTRSITMFAILAMLVAAIAVWMNPADKTDSEEASPPQSRPVLAADIQIQRLETRLSSLEQRSSQQREELSQQIERLQEQVSSLKSQMEKSARKQQPIRPPQAKTAHRKSAKPHASTAPVSIRRNVGWVVNLVSLDSKNAATKALARYKAQGIPAEIYSAVVKGKTWYRLRIGGFASKQEAKVQKNYLATKHGIKDAWVQKP